MHTMGLSADLSGAARGAKPEALAKADIPLAPEERLREIAATLAAGILRLRACHEFIPEMAAPGPEDAHRNSSDFGQKALDVQPPQSPHVSNG